MTRPRILRLAALFALMTALFLAVDLAWIGLFASGAYERHLGPLMADEVRPVPAALFYILYTAGLMVLAVLPGLEAGSARTAAGRGALLGLVAYATFALTCHALFEAYPLVLAVADPAWGAVLSALTARAGYGLGRWMGLGGRLQA